MLFLFLSLSVGLVPVLGSSNTSSPLIDDDLLWGPYRPNLYFGLRPRIPDSLSFGIMWSASKKGVPISKSLRHSCEQKDGVSHYGWKDYDIRHGGTHLIKDELNAIDLEIKFNKQPGNGRSWDLEVEAQPHDQGHEVTIILYLALDNVQDKASIQCKELYGDKSSRQPIGFSGDIRGLGPFDLSINFEGPSRLKTTIHSLNTSQEDAWKVKEHYLDLPQQSAEKDCPPNGNIYLLQTTFDSKVSSTVRFRPASTVKKDLQSLPASSSNFQTQFNKVFKLHQPFTDAKYTEFSHSLLSNLLGGIGYFHGESKVDRSANPLYLEEDSNFWKVTPNIRKQARFQFEGPSELLTCVPSRAFFPRGFLWDEGFHLLIVMEWDLDLAVEILRSWLNLMDQDGWIAREQILGPEARSKVPSEFQVQYPQFANPPSLFLMVENLVKIVSGDVEYAGTSSRWLQDQSAANELLQDLYVSLKKHYAWFRRSQKSDDSSTSEKGLESYRWRGRDMDHTLTSGLDDYPRAQPPSPGEKHIDALSWVGLMNKVLIDMAPHMSEPTDLKDLGQQRVAIRESVVELHWSEKDNSFCDLTVDSNQHPEFVCHRGYISLFPFLLGLIDTSRGDKISAILDLIEELSSDYGLQSLSRKDEFYGTGENYWRSPIWVNINYLALKQLLKLAQSKEVTTAISERSKNLYIKLRQNLVSTVFNSWKTTGFAWEHYNPDTGKGQGTQGFTGWTALVTKIMALPDLAVRDVTTQASIVSKSVDTSIMMPTTVDFNAGQAFPGSKPSLIDNSWSFTQPLSIYYFVFALMIGSLLVYLRKVVRLPGILIRRQRHRYGG